MAGLLGVSTFLYYYNKYNTTDDNTIPYNQIFKLIECNQIESITIYKDISSSKVPKTLSNFLKKNNNIDTIILHFDNDEAGRLATKAVQNSLSDSYKIIDEPPKSGKDFNDYLCDYLGLVVKKTSIL